MIFSPRLVKIILVLPIRRYIYFSGGRDPKCGRREQENTWGIPTIFWLRNCCGWLGELFPDYNGSCCKAPEWVAVGALELGVFVISLANYQTPNLSGNCKLYSALPLNIFLNRFKSDRITLVIKPSLSNAKDFMTFLHKNPKWIHFNNNKNNN